MVSPSGLPLTLPLWLAAIAPLGLVLVLLIWRRWKAPSAAAVGWFLAAALALWVFEAAPAIIALQSVKGVWDALFIAYVILPALLLYEICDEAGAFRAIRSGIEVITPNRLLHVLAFAWVFPSFLQGITGFSAPIAVAAPLLLAIGVRPVWAVVLPIIGHAWGKTFGTLGIAWEALVRVADTADPGLLVLVTGIMLGLAAVLGGVAIAWLFGRWRAIAESWPVLVVCGLLMAGGQLAIAYVAPNLSALVPSAAALLAILVFARLRYRSPTRIDSGLLAEDGGQARHEATAHPTPSRHPPMPLWLAFGPYLLLTVLMMVVELVPAIRDPLASLRFGLPFPGYATGYDVETAPTPAYRAFSPLVHPGTVLLLTSVLAFAYFRIRGYIPGRRIDDITVDALRTSIPTVMALAAFVPLALVMEGAGMTLQLAAGLGEVATPPVYVLLSPLVGALGGFLMGSNLSANILFGPLQEQAAQALGVEPAFVLAAQTAGAAIGSSLALPAVLMGLGVVGAHGQVADALKRMFPFVAVTLALLALVALAGTMLHPVGG